MSPGDETSKIHSGGILQEERFGFFGHSLKEKRSQDNRKETF